jgi:hypothetical protein
MEEVISEIVDGSAGDANDAVRRIGVPLGCLGMRTKSDDEGWKKA